MEMKKKKKSPGAVLRDEIRRQLRTAPDVLCSEREDGVLPHHTANSPAIQNLAEDSEQGEVLTAPLTRNRAGSFKELVGDAPQRLELQLTGDPSNGRMTRGQEPIFQIDGIGDQRPTPRPPDVDSTTKKCYFCGETSATWKILNNHIRFFHDCLHKACNYCGYKVTCIPHLDEHIKQKHNKTKNK